MNGINGSNGVDGVVLLDDGRGHFGPLTDLRSTADLRSGILTTGARLLHDAGLPLAAVRAPVVGGHADHGSSSRRRVPGAVVGHDA